MNTYDTGDRVRVTATFGSGAVDPSAVTAKVKAPTGAITTFTYLTDEEIVRESAGTYSLDVDLTMPGTYWVRFEGSGTIGAAAEERALFVQTPQVG